MVESQSSLLLRKQLNGNFLVFFMSVVIFSFYFWFIGWIFFVDLKKNPVEGFSAGLADDSDIYSWEVLIIGPPDTL